MTRKFFKNAYNSNVSLFGLNIQEIIKYKKLEAKSVTQSIIGKLDYKKHGCLNRKLP